MDFIKEQNSLAASCSVLSFRPAAFPEARKRRIGLVPGSVHSGLGELLSDFEQECCLADLPRACEKLDMTRGGLLEPFKESLAASSIVMG
jgi:hypothetical protein